MPVHKFITKRSRVRHEPSPIKWLVRETPYMPIRVNSTKWEIFAQKDIEIQPTSSLTLLFPFGVRMTRGICLISLRQEIKTRRLSLHDGTVSEDVDDIIITIQNNSEKIVNLLKGASLCYINYHN